MQQTGKAPECKAHMQQAHAASRFRRHHTLRRQAGPWPCHPLASSRQAPCALAAHRPAPHTHIPPHRHIPPHTCAPHRHIETMSIHTQGAPQWMGKPMRCCSLDVITATHIVRHTGHECTHVWAATAITRQTTTRQTTTRQQDKRTRGQQDTPRPGLPQLLDHDHAQKAT